jgi:SNF2 family DNA or RNA helicase
MRTKLWPHQERGIKLVEDNKRMILAWEMGAGKTLTSLEYMTRNPGLYLVVGPKRACPVWLREIQKHYYVFDTIFLANDKESVAKKQRRLMKEMKRPVPEDKSRIVIMNYAVFSRKPMAWYIKTFKWTGIFYDEIHKLKTHTSVRAKQAIAMHPLAEVVVGLTGTPFHNSPLDIFGQVASIGRLDVFKGVLTDRNIANADGFTTRFISKYAWLKHSGSIAYPVAFKELDDLHVRLNPIMDVVRTEDVAEIPREHHIIEHVELEPAAMKLYNKLKTDFIVELKDSNVIADNVLVKLLRLQQMTGGFVNDDEGTTQQVSMAKLDGLTEILESINRDEAIVIFYKFRAERTAIEALITEHDKIAPARIDGDMDTSDKFYDEETRAILVQINSGAEGIDLSRAARVIVYSNTHSLGTYQQAMARVVRPSSQHKAATFHHLICENTLDEEITAALNSKQSVTDFLVKHLL